MKPSQPPKTRTITLRLDVAVYDELQGMRDIPMLGRLSFTRVVHAALHEGIATIKRNHSLTAMLPRPSRTKKGARP